MSLLPSGRLSLIRCSSHSARTAVEDKNNGVNRVRAWRSSNVWGSLVCWIAHKGRHLHNGSDLRFDLFCDQIEPRFLRVQLIVPLGACREGAPKVDIVSVWVGAHDAGKHVVKRVEQIMNYFEPHGRMGGSIVTLI